MGVHYSAWMKVKTTSSHTELWLVRLSFQSSIYTWSQIFGTTCTSYNITVTHTMADTWVQRYNWYAFEHLKFHRSHDDLYIIRFLFQSSIQHTFHFHGTSGTGDAAPSTHYTAVNWASSVKASGVTTHEVPPIPCLFRASYTPLVKLYQPTMCPTWDGWNLGRGTRGDFGSEKSQVRLTFSALVTTEVPLIP